METMQPVDKGSFSIFRSTIASKRNNNDEIQTEKSLRQRESHRFDARELVGAVLPCCQHRPAVHNEIVKLIKRLPLAAQMEIRNFEIPVRFVPCMPPTAVEELEKDLRLVKDHLLSFTELPANRTRLMNLQQQIQTDIDNYAEIKRDKAKKHQEQYEQDVQLLSFVVDQIEDRPHLYNQVVISLQQMNRLQQLHHEILHLQRQRSRSKKAQCLTWKKEGPPCSQERWMDVERLDELLDTIPDTSALRPVLFELQQTCRKEAKRLLRKELMDGDNDAHTMPLLSETSSISSWSEDDSNDTSSSTNRNA